jgi:hypothetical protein
MFEVPFVDHAVDGEGFADRGRRPLMLLLLSNCELVREGTRTSETAGKKACGADGRRQAARARQSPAGMNRVVSAEHRQG